MTINNKTPNIISYHIISVTFCLIAVLSNILSAKMVELPYLSGLGIPAGLLIYPVLFLISDFVTEFFGAAKARFMAYLALAMNLLSFGLIQLVLFFPSPVEEDALAFQTVLGLSGWRIFASLTAYITSQLVDIQIYSLIKRWTGPRLLWLRNNGSACVAQLVDTVIVDIIYFYFGLGMSFVEIAPIMAFSYTYKTTFNIAVTPLFYLCVYITHGRKGQGTQLV